MDPINDDEFIDDTISQEDLTPLHSAPDADDGGAPAPDDDSSPPDPQLNDVADPADAGKKQDFVPHAKFHQANERAKEERMARENAERRLDAILQAVNNQRGQQPQQPQQPVDEDPMPPEDDIVALAQWNARQIVKTNRERQEHVERQRQEQSSRDLTSRVIGAAREDFAQQVATEPSIGEAYDFLRQSRGAELMAQGYSRAEAQDIFQQEEVETYHAALKRRQSPAQTVLALARARGFAPAAAAPVQEQQHPVNDDRRRMHTSLSSASGGEAPRALTAKDLLAMDEDEFARVSDSVVNKLMKGAAA